MLAVVLGAIAIAGLGLTIGGVAADNNLMTGIGLTTVAVPALLSGGMAVFATTGALATTVGAATLVAGLGSGLFASAEYQEAYTGNNWIQNAGISEDWYNGLLLSTAALATVGTITSGVLPLHYRSSVPQAIGKPFSPNQSVQIGVDPNTLSFGRSLNSSKKEAVRLAIQREGMYGVIRVNRQGIIVDGNHRVFWARVFKIAVDIVME